MRRSLPLAVLVPALLTGPVVADAPHMGGEMNHVLVSLYQKTIYVSIERPDELPLTLFNYHEWYDGPAHVLTRTGYNAQFGWLAGGYISLPPDGAMWVEAIDQTPGLRTYSQYSFDPLFTTGGSSARWEWDGAMTHNWYAAYALGEYEARYSVYVGTFDGEPYAGYTPGEITLRWTYPVGGIGPLDGARVNPRDVEPIPAPAGWCLVLAMGLAPRRRRG